MASKHTSRGAFALLAALLLQLLLFAAPSEGAPNLALRHALADLSDVHGLSKRYVGTPQGKDPLFTDGGDSSDYPSDDDIRAAYISPSGASVFFAMLPDHSPAQSFAETINGAILQDAWPAGYVDRGSRSQSWYGDFLDRISGIFADNAGSDVYFVSIYPFNGNTDGCRIWSRIERNSLLGNGATLTITLVDYTNFANQRLIFDGRADTAVATNFTNLTTSVSNDDTTHYCNDWNGYGDDPADSTGNTSPLYITGNCGLHFVQYQKNEGPGDDTSQYRYNVTLFDANSMTIGWAFLIEGSGDVDSSLPNSVTISSGNTDDDPVSFAYGDQSWDTSNSGDHDCSVGAYDSGSRQGDCGFACT